MMNNFILIQPIKIDATLYKCFCFKIFWTEILMKNELVKSSNSCHCMYEGSNRNSAIFSEITDRMYANHRIDGTFSALGKAVGDDYNVSDRAFGIKKKIL